MNLAVSGSVLTVGGGAFADAAGWVAGVLTGTVGTVAAILAVAGVGFALLQGRVSLRRAAHVVLGCFVLFGAPSIAHQLMGLARWSGGPAVIEVQPTPPPPIAVPAPPPPNPDPYAGASVPTTNPFDPNPVQ